MRDPDNDRWPYCPARSNPYNLRCRRPRKHRNGPHAWWDDDNSPTAEWHWTDDAPRPREALRHPARKSLRTKVLDAHLAVLDARRALTLAKRRLRTRVAALAKLKRLLHRHANHRDRF